MNNDYYAQLSEKALGLEDFSPEEAERVLTDKDVELLPLLNAAYNVRKHFVGKSVTIHQQRRQRPLPRGLPLLRPGKIINGGHRGIRDQKRRRVPGGGRERL